MPRSRRGWQPLPPPASLLRDTSFHSSLLKAHWAPTSTIELPRSSGALQRSFRTGRPCAAERLSSPYVRALVGTLFDCLPFLACKRSLPARLDERDMLSVATSRKRRWAPFPPFSNTFAVLLLFFPAHVESELHALPSDLSEGTDSPKPV